MVQADFVYLWMFYVWFMLMVCLVFGGFGCVVLEVACGRGWWVLVGEFGPLALKFWGCCLCLAWC